MNLETCQKIIKQLDDKLILLKTEQNKFLLMLEEAKGLCLLSFWEMKNLVTEIGFSNKDEEILFFKKIKPQILSKLVFYDKLMSIESRRPKVFILQERYLNRCIIELQRFFEENQALNLYYWKDENFLDEFYFLRKNKKQAEPYEIFIGNADPEFSTQHDFTISCIIAYENLIKYLENEIVKLHHPGLIPENERFSKMKWTSQKIHIVEMAYALQSSNVINNGDIEIKVIIEAFSKIFNVDLDDYYRTYQDIRMRKTERTKFLDKMKQSLQNRLDDSDI